MVTTIIKTPAQRIQHRVHNTLLSGESMPKVSVVKEMVNNDIVTIMLKHPQEYVPNIKLIWCAGKKHYRVYIHVASTEYEKTNAGYCICTIKNGHDAAGLLMYYGFLVSHRPNNKSDAN